MHKIMEEQLIFLLIFLSLLENDLSTREASLCRWASEEIIDIDLRKQSYSWVYFVVLCNLTDLNYRLGYVSEYAVH